MAAHPKLRSSPGDLAGRKAELLTVLEECARLDKICPGLDELTRWFGVGATTIHDMLHRLRREKAISWKIVYCGTRLGNVRVVKIAATGKTTATPEMGCRPTRRFKLSSAERTELERAKTVLRRQGRVVFNAEITDGGRGRGLVKVDGRNATPAEVIARAAPFLAKPTEAA